MWYCERLFYEPNSIATINLLLCRTLQSFVRYSATCNTQIKSYSHYVNIDLYSYLNIQLFTYLTKIIFIVDCCHSLSLKFDLVLRRFYSEMKKILAIFLLFVYTGSAFGIAVNYHYCDGHLTHVSILNFGEKNGCKCNPSEMPPSCCKDKMLYLKGSEHKSSPTSFCILPGSFAIDIQVADNTLILHKEFFITPDLMLDFVKQKFSPPLFLLNRVFRI